MGIYKCYDLIIRKLNYYVSSMRIFHTVKIALIIMVMLFLSNSNALALEQIISTKGVYISSSSESIKDAKQNAFNDALRQALEQAGVLVISTSKVHNTVLTEDEIRIISSKIIHVKSQRYSIKPINNDAIEATAYLETSISTDSINDQLNNIINENKKITEINKKLELSNDEIKDKLQYYKSIDDMETYIKKKYTMESVNKMHPWTYEELRVKQDRGLIAEIALGHYYMALRRWDNALTHIKESERQNFNISKMIGRKYEMGWRQYIDFGEIYFMKKDYSAAEFYFREAYKRIKLMHFSSSELRKKRIDECAYYVKITQYILGHK